MHLYRPTRARLQNVSGVPSREALSVLNNPPYPGAPMPPVGPEDWPWPRGFLWGTQAASTQEEGGGTITPDGKKIGDPIDNNFIEAVRKEPWHVADRSIPLPGLNEWNRLGEHIDELQALGCNADAFSIDWSRIEPVDGGPFDDQAMAHYLRKIDLDIANGLEPIITLLHYAIPQWLAEKGGILAPEAVERFERFSRYVVEKVGDRDIRYWNTLNEPNALAGMSYGMGEWPPFEKNPFKFFEAMGATLRLHAAGARAIREVQAERGKTAMISIAHNMRPFHPHHKWNPLDWLVAKIPDYTINHWFIDSVQAGGVIKPWGVEPIEGLKDSFDWIGLNYYVRDVMKFKVGGSRFGVAEVVRDPALPVTTYPDDNTYDPDGVYETLMDLWGQFHLPIMITEYGPCDTTHRAPNGELVDELRPRYLIDFAADLHHAMDRGVEVLGAMLWARTDNWEWTAGERPKFGLISFDWASGAREFKFSAKVFRRLRLGVPAAWRTAQNEQNPVERDPYSRAAAERAGLPGPASQPAERAGQGLGAA